MTVRHLLLVPLLVAGLAGCADGEASVAPTVLPPVTSAPSASPSVPAVPSAAAAPDRQGAEAFATFYYEDLFGRGFSTLDSAPIRAVSAPSCELCRLQAETFDGEKASGRRYEGGAVTVRAAESAPQEADGAYPVNLLYDVAEVRPLFAGPSARPLEPRTGLSVEIAVKRVGDAWRVTRITQRQGSS